jgi:hypothetical protein
MATIKHECPHCRVIDIALVVNAWTPVIINQSRDEKQAVANLSCPRCYMPSGAHLRYESGTIQFGNLANYNGDLTTAGWKIADFWPEAQPSLPAFADAIRDISPTFCDIYGEAHKAEHFDLTQICGVGYRKALEFLMKDYLIKEQPNDKAAIESAMLGQCIQRYVTDPKIKQVAERATWLGNDETHYQRRWMDKDLSDLKALISLVLYWIEAEHLTAETLKSMPPPG